MTAFTNYEEFIQSKMVEIKQEGFEVDLSTLNPSMFDFQKHIVHLALKSGRYAIFADCGLGKTLIRESIK